MKERILVPLDGSEVSEAVLPKIEDLVLSTEPRIDTEVTLMKVISNINFNVITSDEAAQLPIDATEREQLVKDAQKYLESIGDKLVRKGIEVKTLVTFGNAAKEIVETANNMQVNMIAMATHGRSGVARWAMGSVTDDVIKMEERIPVLAIRVSGKKEKNSVLPMGSLQSMVKHT